MKPPRNTAPTLPTADQRVAVLDSLRAGLTLAAACRGAGVRVAAVEALKARDDDWAEQLEDATATGRAVKQPETPAVWAQVVTAVAPDPPHVAPEPRRIPARGRARDDEPAAPLDLARIAAEAHEHAPGPFGYLLWLDERWARQPGAHAMGAWWRYELGGFYGSGKRWLLVCAGRGSGKSTTLTLVAAADGTFTGRVVPPGETWVYPFISVTPQDADRRIDQIAAVLRVAGIEARAVHHPRCHIDTLDAAANLISYMSLASTIAGVSGPSTIGVIVDEEAKLLGPSRSVNPSGEIIVSLSDTFRARPNIRGIRCSSAWETTGSHYDAIKSGDNEVTHLARIGDGFIDAAKQGFLQVAAWEEQAQGDGAAGALIREHVSKLTAASPYVPTWVANPTITALASRVEKQIVPAEALGGLTRTEYWLRECGSVAFPPGASKGGVGVDQTAGLADANAALAERVRSGRDAGRQVDARGVSRGFSGGRRVM